SDGLFFFFQAEDGIRDFHVTGVQTCALPIYNASWSVSGFLPTTTHRRARWLSAGWTAAVNASTAWARASAPAAAVSPGGQLSVRSEERRVGKEWTSGTVPAPCHDANRVGGGA